MRRRRDNENPFHVQVLDHGERLGTWDLSERAGIDNQINHVRIRQKHAPRYNAVFRP